MPDSYGGGSYFTVVKGIPSATVQTERPSVHCTQFKTLNETECFLYPKYINSFRKKY